jgi:GNAT superfamily N-acetyltransferase
VSRRLRDLTAQRLEELPPDCRRCLFWELPDAPRGPQELDDRRDVPEAKQLWHRSTELEWGATGLLMFDRAELLGFALHMPAGQARRVRRLGSAPSDDALVLATLWVTPEARAGGVAKAMVHVVLRRAHDMGLRAVEAVGQRGTGGTCVMPEAFLVSVGFVVHHEHPRYPLLRLDLRQTARWQDAVEHAIEGVRSVLTRRERSPVPSSA